MDFREIMRTVSDVLMIAGATMALATFVLMQYLSRGVYNPLDAIVLILMSLAMLACPALLAAGAVIRSQRPETARNQPTPERPDHRAARQHRIRRRSPHRAAAATAGSSSSGSRASPPTPPPDPRASAESTAPIMPTASGIADASGS